MGLAELLVELAGELAELEGLDADEALVEDAAAAADEGELEAAAAAVDDAPP